MGPDIEINLSGTSFSSKRMSNYWLDQWPKGKISNIVSLAVFHSSASRHAHYTTAKGGVVTFTISLIQEVAPISIKVTANAQAC